MSWCICCDNEFSCHTFYKPAGHDISLDKVNRFEYKIRKKKVVFNQMCKVRPHVMITGRFWPLSCFWLLSVDVITCASCLPTCVSSGYGKLASMPAGGAVAVASSAAAGSGGAAAPAAGEHCSLAPCLAPSIIFATLWFCLHLVCLYDYMEPNNDLLTWKMHLHKLIHTKSALYWVNTVQAF